MTFEFVVLRSNLATPFTFEVSLPDEAEAEVLKDHLWDMLDEFGVSPDGVTYEAVGEVAK
jgi:hypothetical protein